MNRNAAPVFVAASPQLAKTDWMLVSRSGELAALTSSLNPLGRHEAALTIALAEIKDPFAEAAERPLDITVRC
jgi:hypothetical protein